MGYDLMPLVSELIRAKFDFIHWNLILKLKDKKIIFIIKKILFMMKMFQQKTSNFDNAGRVWGLRVHICWAYW